MSRACLSRVSRCISQGKRRCFHEAPLTIDNNSCSNVRPTKLNDDSSRTAVGVGSCWTNLLKNRCERTNKSSWFSKRRSPLTSRYQASSWRLDSRVKLERETRGRGCDQGERDEREKKVVSPYRVLLNATPPCRRVCERSWFSMHALSREERTREIRPRGSYGGRVNRWACPAPWSFVITRTTRKREREREEERGEESRDIVRSSKASHTHIYIHIYTHIHIHTRTHTHTHENGGGGRRPSTSRRGMIIKENHGTTGRHGATLCKNRIWMYQTHPLNRSLLGWR